MLIDTNKLAKIQYHGEEGRTQPCLNAIIRLLQSGCQIEKVKLLTFGNSHCFLLSVEREGGYIVIKSGFRSGYSGEGPRGLAHSLILLSQRVSWIEEYDISREIFERINTSCLLVSDIDGINKLAQVNDYRISDYIYLADDLSFDNKENHKILKYDFPSIVPLRLVDFRIIDLALKIQDEPDSTLMSSYRRLEGIIRKRTGIEGDVIGAKLFTKAFRGENAPLYWENIEPAEREGRSAMFEGIYMAFRNRRAHRELKLSLDEEIREFLLVNELFLLESQAIDRTQKKEET
jgi:hypothetical protein